MERELHELRGQLTRTISAGSEMEELRRGIERSERQRVQLSDHIEVRSKDEMKQKSNIMMIFFFLLSDHSV